MDGGVKEMKVTGPNLNGREPVEGDRGLTSMAGSPEKGVKWGLTSMAGSPRRVKRCKCSVEVVKL